MRAIKFRAWDKVEEMFIDISKIGFYEDGSLWYLQSQDDNENEIDPPYFDSDLGKTWELMQFTGLKDKNGIEIYEGDIYEDGDSKRHVVTFKNGGFGRVGRFLIDYHSNESIVTHEPLINDVIDGCEVIGNIYQNPSLLEEST